VNRLFILNFEFWVGKSNVKISYLALGAVLSVFCAPADAQRARKPPRVGVLLALPYSAISDRIDAFRDGLHELGYVAGQTIDVDYRYADGQFERLRDMAEDLVRSKVEILVSGGPTATRPSKEVTSTIPIIMAQDSDPVGNGFVESLARPGRNITGLSNYAPDLSGKQLELLKEIVPRLSRVAVLGHSREPGNAQALKEAGLAAASLGIRIDALDVRNAAEIEQAFRSALKQRADAVMVLSSPVVTFHRKKVAELAARNRIPAIYQVRDSVEAGGLLTYGVSITDLWRRSATYVDKILKGAKPADLPVEQPTKFELVINLKAAKQIGLTIPPNVLARADRVIK
jgi:putative ABC transport system substrate-binding protein